MEGTEESQTFKAGGAHQSWRRYGIDQILCEYNCFFPNNCVLNARDRSRTTAARLGASPAPILREGAAEEGEAADTCLANPAWGRTSRT